MFKMSEEEEGLLQNKTFAWISNPVLYSIFMANTFAFFFTGWPKSSGSSDGFNGLCSNLGSLNQYDKQWTANCNSSQKFKHFTRIMQPT